MQSATLLVHESTLDGAGAVAILRREEVRGPSVQRLFGGLRRDQMRGLDLIFVPHW